MGKLPAWQFILQLTRKISMPLLIMYIGGGVRECLYCTENNKTVSRRYSGMTKGYLLLPRERLQTREDKHGKSLRHQEAMRKQKWNCESKTEGLCVFLGTSEQRVCILCCQNHIKRGAVKLSVPDKRLCWLSQFSISWIEFLAYCTFPHVPFSLLPYSDTTRSASDMLIACGFIMQGASTLSKKKW